MFLGLLDISDDWESGNSAGDMYVLKQIDQTWTEECLCSIFCWMSCILWVLGGPQALLPAPKPQCITLSPTKFLNIEKMILKSCAL